MLSSTRSYSQKDIRSGVKELADTGQVTMGPKVYINFFSDHFKRLVLQAIIVNEGTCDDALVSSDNYHQLPVFITSQSIFFFCNTFFFFL